MEAVKEINQDSHCQENMLWSKLYNVILVLIVVAGMNVSEAQRRIKGGKQSDSGKRYAVYLIKAPVSPVHYTAWLCGGAIVSEFYIITSAACVEDVQYMYAIAGYRKYVTTEELDVSECTKVGKKKVVMTCVPKVYDLQYDKIEKWAYLDIALVKVESAYSFEQLTPSCDYIPAAITVNYEPKYQEPGQDVMVMGWGHLESWRSLNDTKDYNQQYMHTAATQILDKTECKKAFYPILSPMIDKYMICTLEDGNIDEHGELIRISKPATDGCTPVKEKLMGGDLVCEEDETILLDEEEEIENGNELSRRKMFARILERQQAQTRRNGICQNDHGGPLVGWVGAHEVVLGVASVFRLTKEGTCTGPYLFTSTQCNGAFIHCLLTMDENRRRNDICDKPPTERGFDTIRKSISWENHPDGPAANERIMLRPLVPLNKWQQWGRK